MPAKALELKHTIKLIEEFNKEISEIEAAIQSIMNEINSPITTIPGINFRMGSMIIAEIGDFNNFDSPDKILAFAGLSPSTYQSGQLNNCYAHMEKRGSKYLRYALSMLPSLFVIGTRYSLIILQKNALKARITTLLSLTLSKN